MQLEKFIGVGENIHCTRSFKVGGVFVKDTGNGHVIEYKTGDEVRQMPVPERYTSDADWEAGKVKHCAVAVYHGVYGEGEDKEIGIDYLQSLAKRQQASDASYLDLNVDEFSTDIEERIKLMTWLVETVQPSVDIPMSIDSSNIDILKAGLKACDPSRGKPLLNSVSLERQDAIALVKEFNTAVIASAAGEQDLPTDTPGRLGNLEKLVPMLKEAGAEDVDIHFDPLVYPISTDGNNGTSFLEAVTAIREKYGDQVHFAPGLSNISFGMPNRKLLGQVFAYLVAEAGGDGGIVDPFHVNTSLLKGMDTETEGFKLAKAVLTGEDDFGMNYIMACREGNI